VAAALALAEHAGALSTGIDGLRPMGYCCTIIRCVRIEFTQVSRRHKVGRLRARQVVNAPLVVVELGARHGRLPRVLFLGDDATGRPLEVIAVHEGDRLVVIHVMDLRPKYRLLYERGR